MTTIWFTKYNLENIKTHEYVAVLYRQRKKLHSVTMSLFGDPLAKAGRAEKNILWRIEEDTLPPYLLIQSTVPPTEEAASLPHIVVKPVTIADTTVANGTTVTYRVALSTSYNTRETTEHDKPDLKRRTASASLERNRQRWITRATKIGLDVNPSDLDQRRINIINKHHEPSMNSLDIITGTATISNRDAAIAAIRHGIGKHKAWGCGLLTVTPRRT